MTPTQIAGNRVRFLVVAIALGMALLIGMAGRSMAGEGEEAAWEMVSHGPDLTVYQRVHKGSSIREYKACGVICAEPAVVKRVLDDVSAYPDFMPYVAEARVISSDGNARVSYSRLSPPVVGDRDYTIRVHCETRHTSGGVCYCNRWETANELGPPEKAGVKRVKVTEGSWLLEPAAGGRQTQATYCIYSDSGGALPAFLVNSASKTAIPKLFEAVRKQVLLPKYSGK